MVSPVPSVNDIFLLRVFEEPLVPVGTTASDAENVAVADALNAYGHRAGPDDFSAITDYLSAHPASAWNAALWTGLGFEFYNTGYYSQALSAWKQAWELASAATDVRGKALADRAVGELAFMYARLGRMADLHAMLASLRGRGFTGPATERITGAGEGLATMRANPEIAFKCGPYALYSIQRSIDPLNARFDVIHAAPSTPDGTSLAYLHELSEQLAMNMQMAHRGDGVELIVPSVVHLKLGHYAAITRREGDRYLLQDPTFGRDVWATRNALETESSGYFLIPAAHLGAGWRAVDKSEGRTVWGKGYTCCSDPGPIGPCDPSTKPTQQCCSGGGGFGGGGGGGGPFGGMATARVHLMAVSLNIIDEPVGYTPPVGPSVRFTVRYGQRDALQPANFAYSNFGQKWTFDWLAYIQDNPTDPNAKVQYYMMGGGYRTFTDFNPTTQTFAHEQYDQTLLTRRSSGYEMTARDGSKLIFATPDGATGTTRRVFLTKLIDPAGNAVTLTYDANLRITAITDTIGQVTTLAYENPADIFKITKVTDPFGRAATFGYNSSLRLTSITDVAGLISQFTYDSGDFITAMTTPYGTTTFAASTIGDPGPPTDPGPPGRIRSLEITYPDGSKERVEYNQEKEVNHLPASDPRGSVPAGMSTRNGYLYYRNTFHWDRLGYAYGAGDYTKAIIYHWLHTDNVVMTSGILESVKKPLENRVWYDYEGQQDANVAGSTNKPSHIGRALDDGTTQLHTYTYNGFGNVTSYVDPLGRTTSYLYDADGIDLLEIHQKTAQGSDLLARNTYNTQHQPLTVTDAAGQGTAYTYNTRGQVLTVTNARNETTTYTYDPNGYLTSVAGPLPGQITTYTYDSVGRIRTFTDESQYTLTFDYDALDRPTKITYPDATYVQLGYTALDRTSIRDRAGRVTLFEYDSFRHLTKLTDPLGRVTKFAWCKCGDIRSVTDALGRTTTWSYDLQGRVQSKEYADGSTITYRYEETWHTEPDGSRTRRGTTSRLRQRIDEQLQVTHYAYNADDTLAQIDYTNPAPPPPTFPGFPALGTVPTAPVMFTYDPDYNRVTSMSDGTLPTTYTYVPAGSPGAGQLARIDGGFYSAIVVFSYDELGRRVSTTNLTGNVTSTIEYDAGGRVFQETNPLGTFTTTYDGTSRRPKVRTGTNGPTVTYDYETTPQKDFALKQITNTFGGTVVSRFTYEYDIPGRISRWTQTQPPGSNPGTPTDTRYTYDPADQLSDAKPLIPDDAGHTWYEYDPAGNRVKQDVSGLEADHTQIYTQLSYNALNQMTTVEYHSPNPFIVPDQNPAVYAFDAEQRLTLLQDATQTIYEFTYDGLGRRVGINHFDPHQSFLRKYLWVDDEIREVRDDGTGVITRFFPQGMQIVNGPDAGNYYYTHDHLGSIREVLDNTGTVRNTFWYTPFGIPIETIPGGHGVNLEFGFAGMHTFAGLNLTKHRAYDPHTGRWISRDPLHHAELSQGSNLYAYVNNNPINRSDPDGRGSLTYSLCVAACVAAGGNSIVCRARCAPELFKPDPPLPPPPPPPDPRRPPEDPRRHPYRPDPLDIPPNCPSFFLIILTPLCPYFGPCGPGPMA